MKSIKNVMLEALGMSEEEIEEEGTSQGGGGSTSAAGGATGGSNATTSSDGGSEAPADGDGDMDTKDEKTTAGHQGIWLPYKQSSKCPDGTIKDKKTKTCVQKLSSK